MKKLIFTLMAFAGFLSLNAQVVISQYIETSSGTTPKGIEVTNMSGGDIDLSTTDLTVEVQFNSNSSWTNALTISSGIFPDGEVMVFGTSDMSSATLECGTFTTEPFGFNGDDAVRVVLGGVVTDVFGDPSTVDPGSRWSGSGVNTNNSNIQLKSGITTGDTDGWTDPSIRFETVSTDNSLTGFGTPTDGCPAVAPVDFVSFGGRLDNKSTLLTWQTALEINNDYFQIEYATNGADFEMIGDMRGYGESFELKTYNFTHEAPVKGMNYYRLKQVDFDGRFEYSPVVLVEMLGKGVSIYPNPATDVINVQVEAEAARVEIFNINGQLIQTQVLDNGTVAIANLIEGQYVLRVIAGNEVMTSTFVKQ